MPVEQDGEDVGGTPNRQSSGNAEIEPPRDKREPSKSTQRNGNQDEQIIASIEKEIKAGEKWLIGIGIASVFINTIIALIYIAQLGQMRKATQASSSASETAVEQLMTQQSQFDRTMTQIVDQTAIQSRSMHATEKAASASKTSAEIAHIALEPVIGANIVMRSVSQSSIRYEITFRNEGGSPATVSIKYCALVSTIPQPKSISDCTSTTNASFTILPHSPYPIANDTSAAPPYVDMSDVLSGKAFMFLPIEATYPIDKVTRTLHLCFVYEKTFQGMGDCQDLAWNNTQKQNK